MTSAPFLVTADHLERIAFHSGKAIEFHDGYGFLKSGSMTYRTVSRVGGAV